MTPQQPSRARFTVTVILAAILAAVMAAAAAGLVLSRAHPAAAAQPGGTAAPAAPAPGKTQAQADLAAMQSVLNSGSVAKQAALLVPPMKFTAGSGPVVPPGKTITILPGTLHSSGQYGTVRARVSDGTAVTLGLSLAGGHWRLYAVQAGSAQTSAEVTGQPARVRLLSDQVNPQLDPSTVGKAWPVIFVHGFHQGPGDWGQVSDPYRASMAYQVKAIPGTWVSFFDYGPTSTNWVGDPKNGPALARYVHAVAQASQTAGGPGKVVLVTFSMGGLMARFVAATSMRAADIAMVVTIGTPHEGTNLGDAFNLFCGSSLGRQQLDHYLGAGACEQWSAPRGMTSFSPDIAALGELPPGIAVHEIAGDETLYKVPFGWATVDVPFHGDIAVPVSSALHKRPGWVQAGDTFKTVTNPHVLGDVSAWHLQLQANPEVIALVAGYVSDWIREHPVPAAQGQQPLAGHPDGPDDQSPINVVYHFYDALNAHDYPLARKLGLPTLGGTDQASWVHGQVLHGKASAYVTGQDQGGSAVQVSVTVTWKDGTVRTYAGTYTVSETSWTIESANPFSGISAPALGGDSYWLAGGGHWWVHDSMLQISRGPSGLVGDENWNAGGTIITGHARIAFTSNPDGSLAGTFTTSTTYTYSQQPLPAGFQTPGPMDGPQQGQTFTLVPVAPMLAKSIPGSGGASVGNPYLCQAGLAPSLSRNCGA